MSLTWGIAEQAIRAKEDARFPAELHRASPAWEAFAEMKRQRAARRKAMGFSRGMATYWLARAARETERTDA